MTRRILVVDGSRVVRATLTKHLKDDFSVVEEADGESAWQTLMLDPDIAAVISGIHTPKLEAHDLLGRLRSSSIRRLREVPFVLIVSEIGNSSEQGAERVRGVAGFITKSMQKSAIVAFLNDLLALRETPEEIQALPAKSSSGTELVLESGRFRAVLSALHFDEKPAENSTALVFGLDHRDALIARFGDEAAAMIAARFAALLLSKVSPRDLIGRCRGERLAIISHGVDLKQGVRFGQRVCKSLAEGQITIRGEKLKLTASVGVASTSDDDVATGFELFALADRRLGQALACGGNTVATEYKANCPWHSQDKTTRELIEALSAPEDTTTSARIGELGLQILPLLQVMDRELALGLPLAEIKTQLQRRLCTEEAGSSVS